MKRAWQGPDEKAIQEQEGAGVGRCTISPLEDSSSFFISSHILRTLFYLPVTETLTQLLS